MLGDYDEKDSRGIETMLGAHVLPGFFQKLVLVEIEALDGVFVLFPLNVRDAGCHVTGMPKKWLFRPGPIV